jgi:catechol-2,3-dioxygenase
MATKPAAGQAAEAEDGAETPLAGFDHLDVKVRDRKAAQKFFEEGLGMDVIGDSPDHTFLLFGDVVLGLHDATAEPAGLGAIDHVALRVRQFEGLREWLKSRGITPTGEKTRDDSQSLFLNGPEGLQVELIHRPEPHQHSCSSGPVHRRGKLNSK